MSDVTRKMINGFLPPGSIWVAEEDEGFDQLLEGIADNAEDVRAFLSLLSEIRRPSTTPVELLADLEEEFGIVTNENLTEQQRRDQIAAIKFSKGGNGSKDYLEDLLQAAGYDVYVHENSPPVDPATLLDTDDYHLAGRTGTTTAIIPTEDYSLIFFVGGLATRDGITDELLSIDVGFVPADSAETFLKMIKRTMPMHAWAAIKVVAFKTPYFGFLTDPDADTFGALVAEWVIQISADNDWNSIAWSPSLNLYAAIAGSGTGNRVMTSPDGINWTTRTSAADNAWNSIAWSSSLNLFAAVAGSGTGNRIMTSPDGINWTTRTSAADNAWLSIAWSPDLNLFATVAVSGTGNRVMTSPDGINWTIRTSAADNAWNSIAWSPSLNLFAAVAASGTGNRVMTSPDGINWTIRTSAADNAWLSIAWSPDLNLFAAVAGSGTGNRVMTSPDGINWTIRTSAADNEWKDIEWSSGLGLFTAVARSGTGNRAMSSSDGINWSIQTSAADNQWNGIAWSPSLEQFAAVAGSGTGDRVMIYSSDLGGFFSYLI